MDYNIASVLKQLRKTSNYSAVEVIKRLKKYEIDISAKTLYGYESGLSMPNANVFVALCKIYKCDNPLDLFSNASISPSEHSIIEKYRSLDRHGKKMVDFTLQEEWERSIKEKETTSKVATPTRILSYYYRLASAGTGQILFDMPPTKRIEIPDIPEYRKADYAIGVNGDSMEPVYHDGDMLLVEMSDEIRVGEIGIFSLNGECYVKKLGKGELISLNPKYDNIPLNETAKCMGRVIEKLN